MIFFFRSYIPLIVHKKDTLLSLAESWKKWDRRVFLQTARAFSRELSFLSRNIGPGPGSLPGPLLGKWLRQLREGGLMLGFKEILPLIDQVITLTASGPEKSAQNLPPALEQVARFSRSLSGALEKEPEPQPPSASADQPGKQLAGMRILVAEDIKTSQLYLKKILEIKGAEVAVTSDGRECLEAFREQGPFDAIVMDIFMPGMTGLEATRELRKQGEKIPVIALTALASRDDQRECMGAGCSDYVTKPIEPDRLVQACRKLVKQPGGSGPEAATRKILLVTGNTILSAFLTSLLEQKNTLVETAVNADTALHLFIKKKREWGLLVIDRHLEQKNWREFSRLVRSIRSDIPMLLLVERTHIDDIQNAIKAGFERVLPRPPQYVETDNILTRVMQELPDSEAAGGGKEDILFATNRHPNRQTTHRLGCPTPCTRIAIFQRSFFQQGGDRIYCRRFNLHGRCGIILADVAGHDSKSSLAASWLTGILEGLWKHHQEPTDLLKTVSGLFETSADRDMGSRFICLLVLLYDRVRDRLYYANAGIPPAYLVDTGTPENSTLLNWSGTPIGLLPGEEQFGAGHIDFQPGQRLFLATDGIFETISQELTTRLYDSFVHKDLPDTIEKISDYFIRSLPPEDDLTIAALAAESLPPATGAYRFSIPSSYKEVDNVMVKIDGVLERNLEGRMDWFLLSVALREIVLNAVEHGNKKTESRWVDIDLLPGDTSWDILVSDEGHGFDYHSIKRENPAPDTFSIQGRGLTMLEPLASHIETDGAGILIRIPVAPQMEPPTGSTPQNNPAGDKPAGTEGGNT